MRTISLGRRRFRRRIRGPPARGPPTGVGQLPSEQQSTPPFFVETSWEEKGSVSRHCKNYATEESASCSNTYASAR